MKQFKKIFSLVLSLVLILTAVPTFFLISEATVAETEIWDGQTVTKPAGEGTESSPYLITKPEHLAYAISNDNIDATEYYRLEKDIYLNDITKIDWATGEATDTNYTIRKWYTEDKLSSVDATKKFNGTIDGNGYVVYGLYSVGGNAAGLIPCTPINFGSNSIYEPVTIKNLGIENAYISANTYAAAFIADGRSWGNANFGITISNCYAASNVTINAGDYAGVMIGCSSATKTVTQCYSFATVSGTTGAGLLGNVWNASTVSNCYMRNTKVSGNSAITCTNIYGDNNGNSNGTVKWTSDANMQGLDVLTNSGKMPNLAACDAFMATESYPILKVFYREPAVEPEEITIWDGQTATKPAGEGTEASPYLITKPEHLAYAISNDNIDATEYYRLENDIYLNDITKIDWATGESLDSNYKIRKWYTEDKLSSVDATKKFNGTIDGNGHIVYGLYSVDGNAAGLIPCTPINFGSNSIYEPVTIMNLGIENAYISANTYAAAFIGDGRSWGNANFGITISNCYAASNVTINAGDYAGVMIGCSSATKTVTQCYSFATVTGTTGSGLLGNVWNSSTVSNCYFRNTKVSGNSAITSTNVYGDANTNSNGTVVWTSDANMQGLDVLTNSGKMPNLAACDAFMATETYPILKVFYREPAGDDPGTEPDIESISAPELGKDYIYGKNSYENDFSNEELGLLPENWQTAYKGNGCNFGWAGTDPSLSAKVVAVSDGNGLNLTTANTDAFLGLPKFQSANYIYTANFTINKQGGTVGLFNNTYENLAQADGTAYAAIYVGYDGAHYYVYRPNNDGTTYEWSLPTGTVLNNGDTVTLSLVTLGGYNYLYLGENCVLKYAVRKDGYSSDTVGIYSCNGDITVTDVSIKEIVSLEDFENGEFTTEYSNDFSAETVGTLPENWQAGYNGNGANFGWNNANGTPIVTATVKSDAKYGKVFNFASKDADCWMSLPMISARDYIFETNMVVNSQSGSIGVLSGLWNSSDITKGGISNADAYTACVAFVGGDTGTLKHNGTEFAFGTDPKITQNEEVNVKLISYNGINYVYFNDAFATSYSCRAGESLFDWVGFYSYGGDVSITDTTVRVIKDTCSDIKVGKTNISYSDIAGKTQGGSHGIRINATIDKTSAIFNYSNSPKLGFNIKITDAVTPEKVVYGEGSTKITVDQSEWIINEDTITFSVEIVGLSNELKDSFFNVEAFAIIDNTERNIEFNSETKYICPAKVANKAYSSIEDEEIKQKINEVYSETSKFLGDAAMEELTFSVFADLHYKEGMYISSVDDVNAIMAKADSNNSEFVLSLGDMCNDFLGSKEITNAFLNNAEKLPVYNIYGNHELESAGNSMQVVTPLLTNRADSVVWGTADGKIGDGSIGYYYFDHNGYRIVNLDTNYAYHTETGKWIHNETASYGPLAGTINGNSLGDEQHAWFEKVMYDAASKGLYCIITSHAGFSGVVESSPDAAKVRQLFAKVNEISEGTVTLALSGHLHTNNQMMVDGILYLDINTVRNGFWKAGSTAHYTNETFKFVRYDVEGNAISIDDNYKISNLSQATQTWFFADPLSATIKINRAGKITIDGQTSEWLGGIEPSGTSDDVVPEISSGEFYTGNFNLTLGNISILGDSYSAYSGYIPEGYPAWYNGDKAVKSVEQTWWKQLITETDANLLVNCSYSGSTICNTGYVGDATATSFVTRMKDYFSSDSIYNNADTIFVFGGTNDAWANSPIGQLQYSSWTDEDLKSVLPAFCYMISYIKENNPNARIINVVNYGLKSDIASGMKSACEYYDVDCISLTAFSASEGHPTAEGMTQIKNQIVNYLMQQ